MFIVFEGPDGSGKSTQAKMLADRLKKDGEYVELIHFPRYDQPIGNLIGKILNGEVKIQNFEALQMLYVADQLDFQVELEHLLYYDHKIVIVDRYDLSTIAYYASKTGCSVQESISLMKKWQHDFIQPDKTFLINFAGDLDERRKDTGKSKDLIESDEKIYNSINDIYTELSEKIWSGHITTLDGLDDIEKNSDITYNYVKSALNELSKYNFTKLFPMK